MYYKPIYLPAVISIDIIRNLDIDAVEYSGSLEVNPGKWLSLRLGCSSNRTGFLTGDFSSLGYSFKNLDHTNYNRVNWLKY